MWREQCVIVGISSETDEEAYLRWHFYILYLSVGHTNVCIQISIMLQKTRIGSWLSQVFCRLYIYFQIYFTARSRNLRPLPRAILIGSLLDSLSLLIAQIRKIKLPAVAWILVGCTMRSIYALFQSCYSLTILPSSFQQRLQGLGCISDWLTELIDSI